MKKTWDGPRVNTSFTSIPAAEYNLLLDEWAEIVYCHFCQFPRDQTLVPVTPVPNKAGRSGTSGY